jgi:hypothetical protein
MLRLINVQIREEPFRDVSRNLRQLAGQDDIGISGTYRARTRVKGFEC